MKKSKYIIILLITILFVVSCSAEIPNPIVGTYYLKDKTTGYDLAGLSLKNDSTFLFIQVIPGTNDTFTVKGKYDYTLRAFSFLAADGSLFLKLEDNALPSQIKDSFLKEGTNLFFYSWKCDKNNGPISLTITQDPNDTASIYEFKYAGSEKALNDYADTLSLREDK